VSPPRSDLDKPPDETQFGLVGESVAGYVDIEDRRPDHHVNGLVIRPSEDFEPLSFQGAESRFQVAWMTTVAVHHHQPSNFVQTPQLVAMPIPVATRVQHDDTFGSADTSWPLAGDPYRLAEPDRQRGCRSHDLLPPLEVSCYQRGLCHVASIRMGNRP
jgi:hypothetical protein